MQLRKLVLSKQSVDREEAVLDDGRSAHTGGRTKAEMDSGMRIVIRRLALLEEMTCAAPGL